MRVTEQVGLRLDELFALPGFDRDDAEADYAHRFTTNEDLDERLARHAESVLSLQIIARDALSGFARVFRSSYGSASIETGSFAAGDSMALVSLDPEQLALLTRLKPELAPDADTAP